MINGLHTILYVSDADAARRFFKDVLGFPSVDAGDGWLIFAAPPAELAAHPAESKDVGRHQMYFMCDDVAKTVEELTRKGVVFSDSITDHGWGLLITMKVPGGAEIGLYQPRHAKPPRS
jgi:catechol 2,3-dioxygenase-like lactoylglutathione lyase family enzyme